ncbi:Global cell cycle regulator GcrA [Bosea sp. LC85]|uniref:GcrA family cell cycle regulator n=1 Tax=Bosea sp. LC85 TaxID=1502851 RepID=UPI0004E2F5D3|nr:GcrA family cell cycle regulator [Bosea sp. LC85]KFC73217.1 Global cell cycle regulator GcrA [Bosea sp. LC85]
MTDLGWVDARVSLLKQLAADGLSAQLIAEQLGGVSRSAVIGKAHRLGIQLTGAIAAPPKRAVPKPTPVPVSRRAPVIRPLPEPVVEATIKGWPKPVGPNAVDLVGLDMTKQCRMPLWSNAERGGLYCGEPVRSEGERWCKACAALAYEPRLGRKLDAAQMDAARSRFVRTGRNGAFA